MPKKLAVLIGINKYEQCGQLNFAIQDVVALRDILLKPDRGNYQEEHVKILTETDGDHPHRTNIRGSMQNVSEAAERGDDILFYFSGHGTYQDQPYLLPIDASPSDVDTWISVDWLRDQLERCQASRKLMILDACHSGLEMGKPASGYMTEKFEAALRNIYETAGIAVLSSCKAEEVSQEDPKFSHGVFSYYLTEGLTGPADSDNDNDISVFEAYEYVLRNVKEWAISRNKRQTPTLYAKMAGEIVLVSVPRLDLPEAESGNLIVKTLQLRQSQRGEYYRNPGGYRLAQEETTNLCVGAIGRLGATLAALFGSDEIGKVDQLTRSHKYGRFGGLLIDEKNRFDYVLFVEVNSKGLTDDSFMAELVQRNKFDVLIYQVTPQINLQKLFKSLGKLGFEITSYDPPQTLDSRRVKEPIFEFFVQNKTDGAMIRIDVPTYGSQNGLLKAIGVSGIREIIEGAR